MVDRFPSDVRDLVLRVVEQQRPVAAQAIAINHAVTTSCHLISASSR